jgi:ACS family glucarate transporter-like MFS transporter
MLLLAISVVTYIDRVNISVTARQMMPALGLTEVQMGQVFSTFVVGYALCQIPGGWLGDRWGARLVLTLAVLWWSCFTALTAVAPVLPIAGVVGILGSLILVRFLIGVGEAAALPNFNRAVANRLGPHERGLGIAIAIGGLGLGSALTPPLTAWIMVNFGWQVAFYVSGLAGVLVAALWYAYATERPGEPPHVNLAERTLIEGVARPLTAATRDTVPWVAIARTPSVWWLVLSYTCLGYVAYLYLSWFYLYVVDVRGVELLRGAWLSSIPFLTIAVFCPLSAFVTDRLAKTFGVNRGRGWVGMSGMILAVGSTALGARVDGAAMATSLLSLGAGCLYFTVGAYWSSTVDLSKPHAGTLSGLLNTGANIGGSLSPLLTPWFAERMGWPTALEIAALVSLAGGLIWIRITPSDGLHPASRTKPTEPPRNA